MLNKEQRKALEKILIARLQSKRSVLQDAKSQRQEELKITNEKKNKPQAIRLKKEYDDLETKRDKVKEDLQKIGFSIGGYDDKLSYCITDEDDKKIEAEFDKREKDFENAEMRLRAKVWGMETDFNDLMQAIEKELSKL
jgi:hypothetical protein